MEETFREMREGMLRRMSEDVEGRLARAHTAIEQAFYCGELRGLAGQEHLHRTPPEGGA
jgi:hypothetical protein